MFLWESGSFCLETPVLSGDTSPNHRPAASSCPGSAV